MNEDFHNNSRYFGIFVDIYSWTRFTVSYIVGLPDTWGSPTIIDKNRWSDGAMREILYDFVRFSKSGSDTTVEPNFDERTVSGIQKLSNNKRRQCAFLLYKAGQIRERRHWFFRHSWTSRLACLFSNFDYLNFYSFRVLLRWRNCSSRISIEAHIWLRPSCKGGVGK